jgi:hypothetical protein
LQRLARAAPPGTDHSLENCTEFLSAPGRDIPAEPPPALPRDALRFHHGKEVIKLMHDEKEKDEKKVYNRPELVPYGSVIKLTGA